MDIPVVWIGSSLRDLRDMPDDVKDEVGYALDRVQKGEAPRSANRMKGRLSDVMEIRVDEGGDTYRAIYTVKLKGIVYVLDAFKKKSKRGRKTPARRYRTNRTSAEGGASTLQISSRGRGLAYIVAGKWGPGK